MFFPEVWLVIVSDYFSCGFNTLSENYENYAFSIFLI